MNELPVEKCVDILTVFYTQKNEELWPNKIVKEIEKTTGSKDKPAIINAIGLLEKASIIEKDRTLILHKQKEIKITTVLGIELIDFIDAFEKSYKRYQNLKKRL